MHVHDANYLFCLSDSEDQRLSIRISPLPTDSGFPYALYRQVQLRCAIDTEPAIDIKSCGWRFNNDPDFLENNNKYTLYKRPSRGIVHSLTMILTINGITPSELGLYTCEGKNSAGLKKSATVRLDLSMYRFLSFFENLLTFCYQLSFF